MAHVPSEKMLANELAYVNCSEDLSRSSSTLNIMRGHCFEWDHWSCTTSCIARCCCCSCFFTVENYFPRLHSVSKRLFYVWHWTFFCRGGDTTLKKIRSEKCLTPQACHMVDQENKSREEKKRKVKNITAMQFVPLCNCGSGSVVAQ